MKNLDILKFLFKILKMNAYIGYEFFVNTVKLSKVKRLPKRTEPN